MKTIVRLLLLVSLLAACGETPSSPPGTPEVPAAPAGEAVTLTYGEAAQVELVTSTGRHIYIDIGNVGLLQRQPQADDVLLTTHLHTDHYYKSFVDAFPGQQLFVSEGRIELPEATITGIASAHNAGDELLPQGGTNYIFIIETGGLRIVHFGDIGQEALTDEQLAAIGVVDLAITQFANRFSSMNADNLKGINLMAQLQPRLILPTHSDRASVGIAVDRWPGYYGEANTITLTPERIPAETSVLVLGNLAPAYGSLFNLESWK